MIVQGTNLPLILTFDTDASTFTALSVIMYPRNASPAEPIKSWGLSDVSIDEYEVQCPLEQSDTLNLNITSDLNVAIEIKWKESEDDTVFQSCIFYEYISYRADKVELEAES